MKWFLIIMLVSGREQSAIVIPMNSQEACEAQGKVIYDRMNENIRRAQDWFCADNFDEGQPTK